jgi:predicted HicB family RNase H-like nuclease
MLPPTDTLWIRQTRMGYLQVRDVPDDLHRAARVEAVEAGESLRALVIQALEREVERMRRERERRRS